MVTLFKQTILIIYQHSHVSKEELNYPPLKPDTHPRRRNIKKLACDFLVTLVQFQSSWL